MKNLFIILVLLFVINTISAQQKNKECALIAHELIADMNGLIESESSFDNGSVLIHVSLPDYFSRDLVLMKVSVPLQKWKEVLMMRNWQIDPKLNDGHTISCILYVNGSQLTICYAEKHNRLFFIYQEFIKD